MPLSYRRRNPSRRQRLSVDAMAQQIMLAIIPFNQGGCELILKPDVIARRAYDYAIALNEQRKARQAAQRTTNPRIVQ